MANGAEELNRILDQARDAMVANGMDEATAEATLFGARPATVELRGNLRDLQQMGARSVVVDATAATVTGEGEVLEPGEVMGAETLQAASTEDGGDDSSPKAEVSDSMTKQALLDEAARRGVRADDSMTKAEIVQAINNA